MHLGSWADMQDFGVSVLLSTGWTVPVSSVTNYVVQAPGGQSNVVASQ